MQWAFFPTIFSYRKMFVCMGQSLPISVHIFPSSLFLEITILVWEVLYTVCKRHFVYIFIFVINETHDLDHSVSL